MNTAAPRTKMVHPTMFYATFVTLFATNILALIGFLMAPDIARLVNGQNEVTYAAYEDRIAMLRLEVDRLHSRQYAQAGSLNLQIQELAQRQQTLTEQHTYVKALAAKAQELGLQTAAVSTDTTNADLITGVAAPKYFEPDIAGERVEHMIDEGRLALNSLLSAASETTDTILAELKTVGIEPQFPQALPEAVGGPFLEIPVAGDAVNMVDDANAVIAAFERLKIARNAVDRAPIHLPTIKKVRMSSKYGARTDPFLKRKAFHSGVDFAAPRGTTVISAGAGTVTFAGRKSGYGITVEVSHSNGLITRYAHLSAFLVEVGSSVESGTPIAKVGSTGRSTGPHLHFEVRRDNAPINPLRFLNAGDRLSKLL